MKKKVISIIIIVLVLLAALFAFWFFLTRDPEVPVGEAIRDLLPFGPPGGVDIPVTPGPETAEPTEENYGIEDGAPVEKLFQITDTPVAGFVILGEGASTTVRYTDRATGHIFDAALAPFEIKRITNVTLPKIYEAHFSPDGRNVLYRSLNSADEVSNTSITLNPPTEGSETGLYTPSATVLRGNMKEVTVGQNGTLYYVLSDIETISSSAFNGTGQQTLMSSPFTNWRLSTSDNTLIVWTKAASGVEGYAYTLNTGGTLSRIMGPLLGLSVKTDPKGGGVAYSYSRDGEFWLAAKQDRNTPSELHIFPPTIAEKCAWGTESRSFIFCGIPVSGVGRNQPENWYKGIAQFSDNIWSIDVEFDVYKELVEPRMLYEVDIDVYEPRVSPSENYLVFMNKTDLSLWALRLTEE